MESRVLRVAAASVGLAIAGVAIVFWAAQAIFMLSPGDIRRTPETSTRIWMEVLVVGIVACLGYAGWGLASYIGGRTVRWPLVVAASAVAAVATPVAWMLVIRFFSGG